MRAENYEEQFRVRIVEQDEAAHARSLAEQDQILPGMHQGKSLMPKLLENGRDLDSIRREFELALRAYQIVPPAAEWLLDNYYVIEQQIQLARQDLSPGYYYELPKLARGLLAGYPRVYSIAAELSAYSDNRLTVDLLVQFLQAYQASAPLSMGEVWAIPIMLGIALIENLRRVMEHALSELELQRAANARVEKLLAATTSGKEQVSAALDDLIQDPASRNPTFLVQLVLRLRDQDPGVAPALRWLESHVNQDSLTLEEIIGRENQRRALAKVTAGNIVTSLRLLASLDWHDFFETVSLVERVLLEDPHGTYGKMVFSTRDRYRHVIEKLAQHNPAAEVEIARRAVDRALQVLHSARFGKTQELQDSVRRQHVGYYLIDEGLAQLEQEIGHRPPLTERTRRWMLGNATALYLGSILLITFLLVALAVAFAASTGASPGVLILVAVVTIIPLTVVATGAVNWTVTVEVEPDPPPRLNLEQGIPAECRTMVVIPALIVNQSGLKSLLEHVELLFLANRDDNLHFAILGDFADAPQEHMPEDDELLATAQERIRALNSIYGRADAFFFLQRKRLWNEGEKSWMGWERKRGKLEEFNVLLRGGETSYVAQEGERAILPDVKYVITLDADTELPLQVARHLVGTLAHPLNRAVIDPQSRIVVRGYGIIQPRVDVVAPTAYRSHFAGLFAGDTGLDPYASVVSDVYQDLFRRAGFIGKGIYEVDTMLAVLRGRFPGNLLLSHDLLEGAFVRVGLGSDIELLEDFPSGFETYAQRQHRWVRGDWQITDWLLPRVRNAAGELHRNPLPLIERWKIFDNLRRSLVPPAVLLWLLAAWTILPGSHLAWTLAALLCVLFPFVRDILGTLNARPNGESFTSYLWVLVQEVWANVRRGTVMTIFLLYFTTVHVDAIGRALLRRLIFHQKLLEWTSHAVAERRQTHGLGDYLARMWLASILAILIGLGLLVVAPASLLVATPLLLLWFLAPTIAYSISQPQQRRTKPIPEAARQELRETARRIWKFYEDFAGAEDHWLPPDNIQLEPKPIVAHRTSPTNIGFLLTSTIAAYDFGYIAPAEFAERVERVFRTLDQLERLHGHFFNWYESVTLLPLHPRYISTVDSGNLAASLIALKQACLEIISAPAKPARVWAGLADTLALLEQALRRVPNAAVSPMLREVKTLQEQIASTLANSSTRHPDSAPLMLSQFEARAMYLARLARRLAPDTEFTTEIRLWADALASQVKKSQASRDDTLRARLEILARCADDYVTAMDFKFLYDTVRGVFSIGYNVEHSRRDDSYYDLLASEARLTSFLEIARGEIPVKHWFRMNRPLTRVAGRAALLSWGGTMFEYLMPQLLLRDYTPSLLQQTNLAIIQAQISYAARQGLAWGISESGFYAFDYQFNYQYRAFGVPELSLKRETVAPRVISPYSTFLALPYAPHAALKNLYVLANLGATGRYGYYEALDFAPERVPKGQRAAVVRSYMAHHQGMSLVALDNFLNAHAMQKRFHKEPIIAAAGLLLQERVPRHAPLLNATWQERPILRAPQTQVGPSLRQFTTPHTFIPRAHLLSNGSYSVMLTNAGGGYSVWTRDGGVGDLAVTRWQNDPTLDKLGTFCYIRDVETGRFWSNMYQPTCAPSEHYHVTFGGETIEFLRRDTGIETKTQVSVAPEQNAEIRRLTLTNFTTTARTVELTSYAEVVLDSARSDASHPAFSKLFIESEYVPDHHALLFHRRPRGVELRQVWASHFLVSDSSSVTVREYETDRKMFIGRGRRLADPAAMYVPLSNSVGATLDPIMSLRTHVRLPPEASVTLAFVTGAADSRAGALAICESVLDMNDVERALEAAVTQGQIKLRHLGIPPTDATLYQRFASRVLFPDPQLRAPADVPERSTRGQDALWAYGISGDYPIVLVRVGRGNSLNLVRQCLLAHEFWRLANLRVDLVLVDEQASSYTSDTYDSIISLIAASLSRLWLDKPGGIFVRRHDRIPSEDFLLLESVARVILRSETGDLSDQLNLSGRRVPVIGARAQHRAWVLPREPATHSMDLGQQSERFINGIGGFSEDGKEYVVTLEDEQWTPLPWTNVIANPTFGCLVTEAGLGMTWAGNSQQNKLSPWSNDPVQDPPSEAIYLQDLATNDVWSPTPLPIREPEAYTIRHGAGYTRFEHSSHDLAQTLNVFVTPDAPVKVLELSLKNVGTETRHLRVTFYLDWVIGALWQDNRYFIVTELDASTNAVLARNIYGGTRVAFVAATQPLLAATASREEFLGRNGSYTLPASLTPNARRLANQAGSSLDPCAALQVEIELLPNQESQIDFLVGQGEHRTHARALIQKYSETETISAAFQQVTRMWDELLETVRVSTPDAALDALLNRRLLYQTLACRVWARAAFYQAGGAYGFRDQLQDVMALVFAAPNLAREHVLRAAAHQFPEGDVMHWWHDPLPLTFGVSGEPVPRSSVGVRTRISDDYLWLPYVTEHYVRATGDTQVLDEQIPFVQMPRLEPEQDELYGTAQPTTEAASLYDHCLRALDHGLNFGAHGLPLMGTGDWNDGMNRVGVEGKGESVWLGWFLYANLSAFASLCEMRGDASSAVRYQAQSERLQASLDANGWDGAWYRRAFFDDGTPLGSKDNAECKIDAIAQAWAVISNAAPREQQIEAMRAVQERLVLEAEKLILLLAPPFVQSEPSPGYIQGYPSGIRENGGQYTHGVLWVVLAYALQGEAERAHQLFGMLNPFNHTRTWEDVTKYQAEPYVIAADVYSHPQHRGRGGWTWYTGSAGWMYRVGIEYLLGLKRNGSSFKIEPCIPATWSEYEIVYRHGAVRFEIRVENPEGVSGGVRWIELDGHRLDSLQVPLENEPALRTRRVRVMLGP